MQLSGELGLPNNKVAENASGCGGVFLLPPGRQHCIYQDVYQHHHKKFPQGQQVAVFPIAIAHLLPYFIVITISGYK